MTHRHRHVRQHDVFLSGGLNDYHAVSGLETRLVDARKGHTGVGGLELGSSKGPEE